MYEELVKRLRELHPEEFGCAWDFNFACQQAMHEAANAIDDLLAALTASNEVIAKSKPRWIPMTERCPESVRKPYLCLTDTGYICEVRWTNNVYGLWESDNKWGWNVFDVPQYQHVTHWMPLPEPPKEGKP